MVCDQVEKIDRDRLQYLAFTAHGCFAPLCAFLGGVVAQESLKALTGKFTPLDQWVSVSVHHWLQQDQCDNQYRLIRIHLINLIFSFPFICCSGSSSVWLGTTTKILLLIY